MTAKRVLIVGHTNTLGGVETFIRNIVLNSDKEKVSFDILVHDGSGSCQYENELIGNYSGDGKRHIIHVAPFKRKPVSCLVGLFRLRAVHKDDYDWVHLNTGAPTEIVYCIPLLIMTKARLISHSHIGDGPESFLNGLCRWLLNKLSVYKLACSDLAARWLFGEYNCNDALMVRNGVDTEEFAYSDEARTRVRKALDLDGRFVVGHVGRFEELKNHRRLLRVFGVLKKQVPNAKLCLVGEGALFSEIVCNCEREGLTDCVEFLGIRDDVSDLYSAFDVFVMPSLYEGLPMVLVEAQASGVPIVASDAISNDAVIVNELVKSISLDDSDNLWADAIRSAESGNRSQYALEVEAAGFGIRSTTKALANLYCDDASGFTRIGELRC